MDTVDIVRSIFEGRPINTIYYKGNFAWIAEEIGQALGYSAGGKRFVSSIIGGWNKEFARDKDFLTIDDDDMIGLIALLPSSFGPNPFFRRKQVVLLRESGLYKSLILTKQKNGATLRGHVAEVILPRITRKETPKKSNSKESQWITTSNICQKISGETGVPVNPGDLDCFIEKKTSIKENKNIATIKKDEEEWRYSPKVVDSIVRTFCSSKTFKNKKDTPQQVGLSIAME